MSEMIFMLLLIFGIPALLGFSMARRRGKNPYLWGLLSGVFPFFLVLLGTRHKPLARNRVSNPIEKQR